MPLALLLSTWSNSYKFRLSLQQLFVEYYYQGTSKLQGYFAGRHTNVKVSLEVPRAHLIVIPCSTALTQYHTCSGHVCRSTEGHRA